MFDAVFHFVLATGPRMRWDAMHRTFNEDRNPWLTLGVWSLLGVLAIVFLIAAARFSRRGEGSEPNSRPWPFFLKLLLTAPLNWRQRWMLIRLARRVSPAQPAAIILTPAALRHAALSGAGLTPATLHKSPVGRRLDTISRTLFNEPLPPENRIASEDDEQLA